MDIVGVKDVVVVVVVVVVVLHYTNEAMTMNIITY